MVKRNHSVNRPFNETFSNLRRFLIIFQAPLYPVRCLLIEKQRAKTHSVNETGRRIVVAWSGVMLLKPVKSARDSGRSVLGVRSAKEIRRTNGFILFP